MIKKEDFAPDGTEVGPIPGSITSRTLGKAASLQRPTGAARWGTKRFACKFLQFSFSPAGAIQMEEEGKKKQRRLLKEGGSENQKKLFILYCIVIFALSCVVMYHHTACIVSIIWYCIESDFFLL